jgi:hypothetical protein
MRTDKKKNKTLSSTQGETDNQNKTTMEEGKNMFPGYPVYPAGDDIYNKGKEEKDLDPENPSEIKESIEKSGERNKKNSDEDTTGDNLDVPGSELDDDQENIGSEDEENNYYSIGGDDHDDLDEDKGDTE